MPEANARGHLVPSAIDNPSRAGVIKAPLLSINDIPVVANKTARAALATNADVNASPSRPLISQRLDADTDRQLEVTTDGSTWQCFTLGGRRMYTGSVVITPVANTPTSAAVTFPVGFFGAAPVVMTNCTTAVPGTVVLGTSATGTTSAGTTIYLTRTNTTASTVEFVAVGPVPVTT